MYSFKTNRFSEKQYGNLMQKNLGFFPKIDVKRKMQIKNPERATIIQLY